MSSLNQEFPELSMLVATALQPIGKVTHGDSVGVLATVTLNCLMNAFNVILSQDLVYAEKELPAAMTDEDRAAQILATGNSVEGPVTKVSDLGSVAAPATVAVDLGSVESEPVMPPAVAIPQAETVTDPEPAPEVAPVDPPSDQP